MDLNRHFARYGYIHVPAVLDADEVAATREKLHALYERLDAKAGRWLRDIESPRVVFDTPWFYELMFKPKIVEALRTILEPSYFVVNDLRVARNQCGGWHLDASGEGKQPYLYAPDYRFVKCGIYLQENTAEYGGGIDFAPGAHRFPLTSPNVNLNFKAKTLLEIVRRRLWATRARLAPGDFLAFHSCLPHQSTYPQARLDKVVPGPNIVADVPREETKFAIYFDAGRASSTRGYFNPVMKAADAELAAPVRGTTSNAEMLGMRYPGDYPAGFVALMERHGLRMAGAEPAQAERYRRGLTAVAAE